MNFFLKPWRRLRPGLIAGTNHYTPTLPLHQWRVPFRPLVSETLAPHRNCHFFTSWGRSHMLAAFCCFRKTPTVLCGSPAQKMVPNPSEKDFDKECLKEEEIAESSETTLGCSPCTGSLVDVMCLAVISYVTLCCVSMMMQLFLSPFFPSGLPVKPGCPKAAVRRLRAVRLALDLATAPGPSRSSFGQIGFLGFLGLRCQEGARGGEGKRGDGREPRSWLAMFAMPWVKTYAYAFLHFGAEHSCATYFDVHQGFLGLDHHSHEL